MAKKKKQDLKKVEESRKKQSEETMSFNRFLLFRYVVAFFFFLNLYWLVLLIMSHKWTLILPLGLLITVLPAVWEHFKKLHDTSNKLPFSKAYFWVQLAVNVCLLLSYFTPLFTSFYPFMSAKGNLLMVGLLIVGILACLYMERRAAQIEHDRDRYLKLMKDYKDAAGR